MSLTPKQQRFVEEYLIDLNATQAAIRAGYTEKTAYSQGQRLLKNAEIQIQIDKAKEKRSKRTQMTADDVLRSLAEIASVDIAEAFNDDGTLKPLKDIPVAVRKAIAGIDVQEADGKATVRKIRFWSKDRTLEMLGRHFELFTDKVKHEGLDGLAESLQKRRERAKR